MIININKTNQDRYLDLFTKAYKKLNNSEGRFSSLEEFYNNIKNIYTADRSYAIRLPVDEPTLYIDANLRTIDTKPLAKKIATVQSDMMAETLIFSIDRYFDLRDFAAGDPQQVWVQWIMTGTDGTVIEGADPITIFDLETEKDANRVRFGWPLTNAITERAGKLQFAVRIFEKGNVTVPTLNGGTTQVEKIIYSFNTLPATLTIEKALLPELNDNSELNYSSNYFDYIIRNSVYAGNDIAEPQTPTFDAPGLNLPIEATLVNDTLTLKAQAVNGDACPITYKWYHVPVDPEAEIKDCAADGFGTIGYAYGLALADNRAINDEYYSSATITDINVENRQDVYYYPASDPEVVMPAWTRYTDASYEIKEMADPTDATKKLKYLATPGGVPLYEKYTTFTVPVSNVDTETQKELNPVTGRYYVEARGTKTVGDKTVNGRAQRSRECVLVSPSTINASELPGRLVMRSATAGEDAKATLAIGVIRPENDNTNYSYSWQRYVSKNATTTASTTTTAVPSVEVTEPGYYKVVITADLNRQTNTFTSGLCKVTDMPAAPTLTIDETNTTEGTGSVSEGYAIVAATGEAVTLKVNASVTGENSPNVDSLYSEGLVYNWLVCKADMDSRPLELSDLVTGDDLHSNKIVIAGPAENETWQYICTVTNTLNEEVASSTVRFLIS